MRENCKGSFLDRTACRECERCLDNAKKIINELKSKPICELLPREYFALMESIFIAHMQMGHENFEILRTGRDYSAHIQDFDC